MTPHETTLLAAADRLRRVFAGSEHPCAVYGRARTAFGMVDVDRDVAKALADAILAAIPAGPEPVAMELEEFAVGDKFWGIRYGYDIQFGAVIFNETYERNMVEGWDISECEVKGYPTEAAARLALAWRNFRAAFGQESADSK